MKPIRISIRRRPSRPLVLLFLLLFCAVAGFAQPPAPEFMKRVYPPELVMANHRAIDLSRDQRKSITKAIQATQSTTLELSWSLQDAAGALTKEMTAPEINRDAALKAAKEMMTVEGKVKRAHLGLLIEIKNTLTAEQEKKLDAIRAEAD